MSAGPSRRVPAGKAERSKTGVDAACGFHACPGEKGGGCARFGYALGLRDVREATV